MQFQGRGFYNTVLFSSSKESKKWKLKDPRHESVETLFQELESLDIPLSVALFKDYATNADSPEDLTDILCPEGEDHPHYEKAYLLIFELWRRLLPEKETLSVFCDKLDHLIHDYDEGKPVADELVKALQELVKIFEGLLARGLTHKETTEQILPYLAHDLETFLYDFLSDLLEAGEKTLTFELLFGFYDFLDDRQALDLLKATLNLIENPEHSKILFSYMIETLFEKKRFTLILDAIYFTHDAGFTDMAKNLASELLHATSGAQKQEILELLEPLSEALDI